ncbi:hypothetical protein PG994_009715 [Apiospora phragmitis]|uniref:WW domain-containing protein n=1 Tax=Apiospora phragmitis TaxID=2905665 RepID=A0ABR1U9M2_9PEZI
MSVLPEGWEWDYDGTRWLYRYKPSGLVQYHFPKPGDEFPEYVGFGIGSFDLEPEERLASDIQTKRRDTLGGTQSGAVPNLSQRQKKPPAEIDEIGATGYFDPEEFMYLGPGGYADVLTSPEEEDGNRLTGMENISVGGQVSSNATQVGHEPLPLVSQPSGGPNDAPGSGFQASTHIPSHEFLAELASQDTQKCADELAPSELDASHSFTGTALAELSSEGPSGPPPEKGPTGANTNNHSAPSAPIQQPIGAYPLVYASFSFRPSDKDHTSGQSPSDSSINSSGNVHHNSTTASPQEGAIFQAWKPGTKPDADESGLPKRSSLVPWGSSLMEFQNRELGHLDQRRYSSPAQVPTSAINRHPTVLTPSMGPRSSSRDRPCSTPGFRHSPIPAVLRPANRSESPLSQSQTESIAPSSNQETIPLRDTDLTHCPSVLKPAKACHSRPHASTISGSVNAAPGLRPAGLSPPPLKTERMHHHGSKDPPLRMPDFPDYNDHPHPHRVNTMPDQLPSQSHAPSSLGSGLGPGFFVFHAIKPGKDPLVSEITQVMEAQELSTTERPVELSLDPIVPSKISATQVATVQGQQAQATSEYGNSLGHMTTQQAPIQTNSSNAPSSQPQLAPSSHTNETVHDADQSAASEPQRPVTATNGSQTPATSQGTAAFPASQTPNSSSSTSGSLAKLDQSSQTNHMGTPTVNNADLVSNGSLSGSATADLITNFAPLPQTPSISESQASSTTTQQPMPSEPHFPLSTPGDGPESHVQAPAPIPSVYQDHDTIQGLQHSKPPPNPPSQIKPQQVHTQQSSTMNTEWPPAAYQEKPPQSAAPQQVQRPPSQSSETSCDGQSQWRDTSGAKPISFPAANYGNPEQITNATYFAILAVSVTHDIAGIFGTKSGFIPGSLHCLPLSSATTIFCSSHTPPAAGHQSANSPVHAPQSQQAQAPYQTQSPSNGNAPASLGNVGQDMKKWAKKMWKSPTFQQTTAVIGGALMAESMGGDGVAGAMAAHQLYNTSQDQQPGQQPPRPHRPPHVHAQTAPPQSQGLPGPRPNMQPVQQPASNFQPGGVQAPGQPYAVQNPPMQGAPMQMQQRPPAQAPMMSPPTQGQQGQYAMNQPPPQTQGQYIANQQPQYYIPPSEHGTINQQQTINQNFTMNSESNVNAADGSMAAYSQQPAVIQNNQIIIESNQAASESYFAQPPVSLPATSNDVNITNINIEANLSNAQYTQVDLSATYYDNSTTITATDYSTATSTDYNMAATDYNSAATTNVDFQMETMYVAADDVTTMYSTENMNASQGNGEWAAEASATVDYSGGDWGDDWY